MKADSETLAPTLASLPKQSLPKQMTAAVFRNPCPAADNPLSIETVDVPKPESGQVLLRVKACGVCHTDLHIVEGELPQLRNPLIPGHQVVGEVVACPDQSHALGARVGLIWLGGTDGTCPYCKLDVENLCDNPIFTGYSVDGGYAQFVVARADFAVPLSDALNDLHTAPLLCAGVIGFRSLHVAGVQKGERVGLFGFGASAHLTLPVLQHWGCEVYVSSRGEPHRELARSMGADWVGTEYDKPPKPLDRAVVFAPSGDVVVAALSCLRKGGVVAINAIHLDRMPEFDYDSLLWEERQMRSVANVTRADAHEFLKIAGEIELHPKVTEFQLSEANQALQAIKNGTLNGGAAVLLLKQ